MNPRSTAHGCSCGHALDTQSVSMDDEMGGVGMAEQIEKKHLSETVDYDRDIAPYHRSYFAHDTV